MRRIIFIPVAAPDTSAMRRYVRVRTYNIHLHIHDCACHFHLRSHLGRDAPPSATHIMRAAIVSGAMRHRAMPHARRSAPRYLGEGCTCTYAHSFLFSFLLFAVIQLTVVASLHRADVFRVRLGGHCREFGVKPCSNGAYFSIRRSQRTV